MFLNGFMPLACGIASGVFPILVGQLFKKTRLQVPVVSDYDFSEPIFLANRFLGNKGFRQSSSGGDSNA